MKTPDTWNEFFASIKESEYAKKLNLFLNKEYSSYQCYPPRELLFNAFKLTKLANVKVVIIGQDPYHEPGQAMGLCFSVPNSVKVPPSLINIYKEIESEYGVKMDMNNGDLTYLANQGVLMLNAILSVRAHQALSHNIPEYQMFFHDVLRVVDEQKHPIVFMLWGAYARNLKKFLHNPAHLILESNHPSPLSANHGGWFNNGHFKKANEFLIQNGLTPIDWCKQK